MLIGLQDTIFEVRPDPEDPSRLFLYARIRGDLERFAPTAKVKRRRCADFAYTATIHVDEFLSLMTERLGDLRPAGFNAAPVDDPRRATLYRALTRIYAAACGSFGVPGSLADVPTKYDDDPDVDAFLKS